jgi:hypothetical protein
MQHEFIDGIGSISVAHGVVRIEALVQTRKQAPNDGSAGKDSNSAQVAMVPTMTLNVPIDGFVKMVPALQAVIDKLVKDGVVKVSERTGESSSPNFN